MSTHVPPSAATGSPRRRLAPLGVALHLALAASLLGSGAAHAQAQAYAIAPGPLADALNRYAQQSGVAIAMDASKLQGLTTPGLQGSYRVEEGFAILLRGSGYAIGKTAAGYVLVPAADARTDAGRGAAAPGATAPAAATAGTAVLPSVTVTGSAWQETATGPARGIVATRSASGTKTDTPLLETPQAISVVTAAQLETLRPQTLRDALAYTAGIATRSSSGGFVADDFYLRGFEAYSGAGSIYRDGSKYSVNLYDGQQAPYGLERIEVLKGAASVLYGNSAPGGIVNAVTKRPSPEPLREVNLELGSFARKQLSADLRGALNADQTWSYRVTALVRDSDTFVDHVPDDRSYLGLGLMWQPTAATSLTLLASYQKSRKSMGYALPAAGSLLPHPKGPIATHRFTGEPGYDRHEVEATTLGYLLDHRFSDALKLRHNLRWFNADQDYRTTGIRTLVPGTTSMYTRGQHMRDEHNSALTTDTALEWQAGTGRARSLLTAGVDTTRQDFQSLRFNRDFGPIDLYNPVYGSAPLSGYTPNTVFPFSRDHRAGLYLQEQLKIDDRWVLLAGLRHDKGRSTAHHAVTGAFMGTERSSANTARAGAVYLADNGLAPFVSYSQSFEPQSGVDRLGQRFKPTQGEQFEAGVRWQPADGSALVSANVYQLTQRNVLTADPDDTTNTWSVQTGEMRSRGLELEAKARVGRHANLIAAYAYTDARITESNRPAEVGLRRGGVPYHQLSVWGDYALGLWGMPGLRIGGGLRHVGSTKPTSASIAAMVPAFTVFDAMVSYEDGPWRLALNVSNLADKVYIASCSASCYYGERRRFIASVGYRW